MGRTFHSACLVAALLLLAAGPAAGQTEASREAVTAMQRGDFPSAEKILRAALNAKPDDAWELSLLGVALDSQKRLSEAEDFHRRAIAQAPRSSDVLNNYGTHLWYSVKYDQAETVFANALALAPGYFKVLYNLGVMATYTHHYERAREVLESALQQQPGNVDVLYRLACVAQETRQWESAVARLAQAAKIDPRRPDVQKLLALATTELGALDDAAAAWDRYLKLEPDDEPARRERGYTAVQMGKFEQGTIDLEWYLARHPEDPVGHYELGQAQRTLDTAKALAHLDRALALDSNYMPARTARGNLYNQLGKPEAAVKDLEAAVSLRPDDAANLDRLGQTYQSLDRPADAVPVLRKAAQLAPEDSKTLLHLARALADAGNTDESKVVMERFRQLGPEKNKSVPAGLVEYLSLTPEQRHVEYRARVESAIRDHPDDLPAQVAYLKLMLAEGDAGKVTAIAERIAAMKAGVPELADAGHALVEAGYYDLARRALERTGSVHLDLALATFLGAGAGTGANAGLALLDRIPEAERSGDYYLARAQMLHASGKSGEAIGAVSQALAGSTQPDLYLRAAAFLVKTGNRTEALRTITEAARLLPENRDILLMRATTLEWAQHTDDSLHLLNEIQGRWPEWSNAWLAHGMILDSLDRYEEARKVLETAVGLGARSPEAYFYLADSSLHSGADRKADAENAIGAALKLAPADPWIWDLGGRIAMAARQPQLAADRELEALRLRPQFGAAHKGLADAYRAMGEGQEADRESAKAASTSAAEQPPYLAHLFQGSLVKLTVAAHADLAAPRP